MFCEAYFIFSIGEHFNYMLHAFCMVLLALLMLGFCFQAMTISWLSGKLAHLCSNAMLSGNILVKLMLAHSSS